MSTKNDELDFNYTNRVSILQIAKKIDRELHSLCGMRVMPVGLGDEDVVDSRHGGK